MCVTTTKKKDIDQRIKYPSKIKTPPITVEWLDFSVHYSVLFQGVAWDAADDSATATMGISAELIRRVH